MSISYIGIDVGYHHTKVCIDHKTVLSWDSVIGSPDLSRFRVVDRPDAYIQTPYGAFLYGETAALKSRSITRREDRDWISSDTYKALFLAALSRCPFAEGSIVTGLPVAFYGDHDRLSSTFANQEFTVNDRPVTVRDVVVIPQPFGSLIDSALDWSGNIADIDIAIGHIGVIDVGGKTTNILTAFRMEELPAKTTSVNVGGWDVIRSVSSVLEHEMPDVDLRDVLLADAVKSGRVSAFGKYIDITKVVTACTEPIAFQIIAQASQVWGAGAALDCILLTGGAAAMLHPYLSAQYPHVKVVADPMLANVRGFYKYGKFLSKK